MPAWNTTFFIKLATLEKGFSSPFVDKKITFKPAILSPIFLLFVFTISRIL